MQVINVNAGEFVSIKDASIVVGSSLIYERNFAHALSMANFRPDVELLPEEPALRLRRVVDVNGYDFLFSTPPQKMGDIDAEIVPFNVIHPYNYFHFLIESLPSLVALVQAGFVNGNSLVVTGFLHENMHSALTMALPDFRAPMLQLGLMQYVTSAKVVAAQDSFWGAELLDGSLSPFSFNAPNLQRLRSLFYMHLSKETPSPCIKGRRLYIQRASQFRKLVNSDKLAALARSIGYEILDPGDLSFREQMHIFGNASHICGPTGAWIANLVFVPQDAKVTIFLPDVPGVIPSISPSMWVGLGSVFGITVQDQLCPIVRLNSFQPIHSDYFLDESIFLDCLSN